VERVYEKRRDNPEYFPNREELHAIDEVLIDEARERIARDRIDKLDSGGCHE
jgi:hypothetical protein